MGEAGLRHQVPAGHQATRPQHPARLRQRPVDVADVQQHAPQVRHVKGAVPKGQLQRVSHLKSRVAQAPPGRRLPGHGDLGRLDVDSHQLARRHCLSQPGRQEPRPAAHVQQPLAGNQMGNQKTHAGLLSPALLRLDVDLVVAHGVHRGRRLICHLLTFSSLYRAVSG